MELKEWYLKVLRQYTDFSGRARRREYWMFVLANFIIAFVLGIIDTIIGWGQILSGIYSVAVLLPSLAVAVRRLHDIGKSGWWLFLCLIPLIGGIWVIVLMCKDSQYEANQWGAIPKVSHDNQHFAEKRFPVIGASFSQNRLQINHLHSTAS